MAKGGEKVEGIVELPDFELVQVESFLERSGN